MWGGCDGEVRAQEEPTEGGGARQPRGVRVCVHMEGHHAAQQDEMCVCEHTEGHAVQQDEVCVCEHTEGHARYTAGQGVCV